MPSSTSSNAAFAGAFGGENQSNQQSNGLPDPQSTLNGTTQANAPSVSSAGQANDHFRSRGSTPASSQARSPTSELSSNKQKTDLNKLMSKGGNGANVNPRHQSNGNRNYSNNNNNNNSNMNQRRGWDNRFDNNRFDNNYRNNNNNRGYNNNNYHNLNRRPGYQTNSYSNSNGNNFNRGNGGGFRHNDDRLSNNRTGGYRNYHQSGYNNMNSNYNRNYNDRNGRKFVPNPNKKLDATLKTEFDFEKANQVFQQMVDKLEDLNISVNGEKIEKSSTEDKDETRTDLDRTTDKVVDEDFYDKTKSFFDKISCEAIERTKGNQKKFDWKQERKLNAETFGIKVTYRRNDGGFRRPGFINHNRFNQNRRFNNNNNGINQQRNEPRTNSS